MGKLNSSFKKALIEEIISNISTNTSHYYAFSANPIPYIGNTPAIENSDYYSLFTNNWQLLFGKKIKESNIVPVILKNVWASNTVYNRYDNTNDFLHSNNNFYVITEPDYTGGTYDVFKCIDNANGISSTIKPSGTNPSTFQTADGYKWRYVSSISYKNFITLSTTDYSPIYTNNVLSAISSTYTGVDVVMISNGGVGYSTYHNGVVASVSNSSLIQIQTANSSPISDFYTKSAIYFYNELDSAAQLFEISQYVANSSGKWVYLKGSANTDNITPDLTLYKISPKVVFTSDGEINPAAYSVVNSTANSIDSIVILDSGTGITWCNVVIQCNTAYGSGSNLYAIVPPPGGHGYDPASELDVKGLSINFNFSNSELGSIVTSNVPYNKIGVLKNPYTLTANNTRGDRYTSNTFSQVLKLTIVTSNTFTVGDYVTGNTSNAIGTVAFSNSTTIYLTGDKHFEDGEVIISSNTLSKATISIDDLGDVYAKDLQIIYFENINTINRSNTQTESFNLIIQI